MKPLLDTDCAVQSDFLRPNFFFELTFRETLCFLLQKFTFGLFHHFPQIIFSTFFFIFWILKYFLCQINLYFTIHCLLILTQDGLRRYFWTDFDWDYIVSLTFTRWLTTQPRLTIQKMRFCDAFICNFVALLCIGSHKNDIFLENRRMCRKPGLEIHWTLMTKNNENILIFE